MPPRWPREPDRKDPDYRRLDDRMNFAVHVAVFAALNSGFWFFDRVQGYPWPWLLAFTGAWGLGLLLHGLYIFGIAKYEKS